MKLSVAERFWKNVDKTESCWNWRRSLVHNGYGKFNDGTGKIVRSHRFSYALQFGPIPNNMLVCHKCDNRKCVRPDHLYLGTAADNTKDMLDRRRQNNSHKLSLKEINEIRLLAAKGQLFYKDIAAKYGISRQYVSTIVRKQGLQNYV